jgi:hypothetical protein
MAAKHNAEQHPSRLAEDGEHLRMTAKMQSAHKKQNAGAEGHPAPALLIQTFAITRR